MAGVAVRGIRKRFAGAEALAGISLDFPDGGFFGLLGPSGSGKTTLLRIIAGFEHPDSGRVEIGGEDVARMPVERRRIGMVFQSYALFPNMTVAENVAFGLRAAGVPRAERATRAAEALALVRLQGLGERRPHQLSGGQRQRVALARAIVTRPRVLLLDEPLSALDKALREEMQVELKRIQREVGVTTIFVTHDQEEALTLSDRIGILRDGRLVEEGPPETLYAAPRTRFAAEFLGAANILTGEAVREGLRLPDGAILRAPAPARMVAIRPEAVTLAPDGSAPEGWTALTATVTARIFAGARTILHLERHGTALRASLPGGAPPALVPGAEARLAIPPDRVVPLTG